MYKHSACSSVITPSFFSSLPFPSLTLSISCTFHLPLCLHTLTLSLSPSVFHPRSSLCGRPRLKFACKVMKSHRRTPVPAKHTLSSFETLPRARIHNRLHILYFQKTQTYFPINNACWSYRSRRSGESGGVSWGGGGGAKPRGRWCTSLDETNRLFKKMESSRSLEVMTLFNLIIMEGSNETTWLIVIPQSSLVTTYFLRLSLLCLLTSLWFSDYCSMLLPPPRSPALPHCCGFSCCLASHLISPTPFPHPLTPPVY